jgi:hypothetical protein
MPDKDPWDPGEFTEPKVDLGEYVGIPKAKNMVLVSMMLSDLALAYVAEPENWPRFRRWVQDGNDQEPPTERQMKAYSLLHHQVVDGLQEAKEKP